MRDEHTSSHDMIRVTGRFKQILGTLELSVIAIGGGQGVITVGQCVLGS